MSWEDWKEREKMYACWLCSFPNIGNRQLHRLSESLGGPEGVYFAGTEQWEAVLSPKQAAYLKEYTAGWRPKEAYYRMRKQGIEIITMKDERYPRRLKHIPDAPFGLFVKGRMPEENAPAVAVIGARECSEYGRYVAQQLGTMLGRCRITVISGMARGIDSISQEAALDAGGSSAGVLGCGVDICYPAQNRELYDRLADMGGLISSYPPGTPARSQNFPPRNRIVSGLADAVVVVEAREKSGTLITVDMALEQGREVYVVPGRVTDRLSDGCNRLIKQGAGVILNPEEFVEELWELREKHGDGGSLGLSGNRIVKEGEPKSVKAWEKTEQNSGKRNKLGRRMEALGPELAAVYEVLDFSPRSAEDIRGKLSGKYRDQQIITFLMKLCMENLAVQVSPGRFSRAGG